MSRSLPNRALHAVFSKINRKRQWYGMPTAGLKVLNLLSLRIDLRDFTLFDTGTRSASTGSRNHPLKR